jgi:S-layer homology domain
MPVPREWLGGATLGSAFYAVGGVYPGIGLDSSNNNQRYTNTCPPAPPPPTATLCATPFGDIGGDAFYGAIAYLYCRGAVSGTDATHYSPAGTSTRGQFARVVVKGFGLPITTPSGGAQSFTDVPPAYFAYNYVETGLAAGFLSGYTAAQCAAAGANYPCYLPNRPITRAELTKLVVKAAGYAPVTPSGGPTFVDVPASYFAYGYIETAYQHGIIRGIDATHFQPDRIIRRDEMAQIVYKGYITP